MAFKYDQNQLNEISNIIDKNISLLLQEFNIRLSKTSQMYTGTCPLHPSKNNSSFSYYHNKDGQYKRSTWRCWSNMCHVVFQSTSIGFVRGLLSNRIYNWAGNGDRIYSFNDTINWVIQFLGIQNLVIKEENEGPEEIKEFTIPKPTLTLTPKEFSDMIRKSKYFLNRGFSSEILDFYLVGQPIPPIRKFYFREFVPIYDCCGEHIIGATCRSVFEKCPKCLSYHDKNYECPNIEWRGAYCKWKNWEFNRAYSLYNLWNAKEEIKKQKGVILVESPGNLWRLWEAGFKNCVASYGTELSYGQIELLKRSQAGKIYLLYDNDNGGREALRRNGKKLWQDFYLHKLEIPNEFGDIGEMGDIGKIQEIIDGQIKRS